MVCKHYVYFYRNNIEIISSMLYWFLISNRVRYYLYIILIITNKINEITIDLFSNNFLVIHECRFFASSNYFPSICPHYFLSLLFKQEQTLREFSLYVELWHIEGYFWWVEGSLGQTTTLVSKFREIQYFWETYRFLQ